MLIEVLIMIEVMMMIFVYNYLDVRKEVGGISSVYVHMLYTT